jgi:hypothetical protein
MRAFHGLAAMALASGAWALPATGAATTANDALLDERSSALFDLLRAGQSLAAYDATLGRSPLMAGKEAERQQMAAQIDTALRIYGPIGGVELVKQTSYGSMMVKRFYVAQHQKMLTRWEINFSRLPTGWTVTYLGFEDQARSWE